MDEVNCPLCSSPNTTADSEDPRVRYCEDCGAMLNVGGVDGVVMESLFKGYRGGDWNGADCG
jgi:hypothetical protein